MHPVSASHITPKWQEFLKKLYIVDNIHLYNKISSYLHLAQQEGLQVGWKTSKKISLYYNIEPNPTVRWEHHP